MQVWRMTQRFKKNGLSISLALLWSVTPLAPTWTSGPLATHGPSNILVLLGSFIIWDDNMNTPVKKNREYSNMRGRTITPWCEPKMTLVYAWLSFQPSQRFAFVSKYYRTALQCLRTPCEQAKGDSGKEKLPLVQRVVYIGRNLERNQDSAGGSHPPLAGTFKNVK